MVALKFPARAGVRSVLWLFAVVVLTASAGSTQTLANAPSAQKAQAQKAQTSDTGWPRTFTSGPDTFLIHMPQVDKWDGNRLYLYSAVEVRTGKDSAAQYGVIWFDARTEVDKINRLITLDQVQVSRVKFPVASNKEAELTTFREPTEANHWQD